MRCASCVRDVTPSLRNTFFRWYSTERLKRGAQLLSGVEAAPLAAQPLPVQKLRPGELESYPGAGEVHDRLAVETVGDIALAQQRAYTGFDCARPTGADHAGSLREPLQGVLEQSVIGGPGRRLGQLGEQQRPAADRIWLERLQTASRAASCRPRPL
jgi:hypothetical protein